jgi:hypothetical protein
VTSDNQADHYVSARPLASQERATARRDPADGFVTADEAVLELVVGAVLPRGRHSPHDHRAIFGVNEREEAPVGRSRTRRRHAENLRTSGEVQNSSWIRS